MSESLTEKQAVKETTERLDLLGILEQVAEMAKMHRSDGQGLKVSLTLGDKSAGFEITPQPVSGGGWKGKGAQESRKATLQDLQNIVMEYPDLLELVEQPSQWIIRPKKFAGDQWTPIMNSLRPFGAKFEIPQGEQKKAWVVSK